jgi:Flp pilus assembly protein TadB
LVRYATQRADVRLGVAFSKDPGGKTMKKRTLTQRTGQARGDLMRRERDLNLDKGNLKSATRNRIVGGVILLIGVVALIQVNVAVGVVVLAIGGWVFVRAFVKMGQERRSIDASTDRVTDASAKLDELKAQAPDAG